MATPAATHLQMLASQQLVGLGPVAGFKCSRFPPMEAGTRLLSARPRQRMSFKVKDSAQPNAAAVSSRAMSDFADQQTRKFRDDLMVILERDGFTDDLRAQITELCSPVMRKYAASYAGTVPPEPFAEMRRTLEGARVERWQDVVCAAIGWARWNMARDFRKWNGKPEPTKTEDPRSPSEPNKAFDPKSKN